MGACKDEHEEGDEEMKLWKQKVSTKNCDSFRMAHSDWEGGGLGWEDVGINE